MSDANRDLSGSAARHHEQTGGNVPTDKHSVPFGGDAARQAETYGDSTNEAHGIRTVPRGEFRAAGSLSLPNVRGVRLKETEESQPDISQRTAADYLPPQLKAQLIAEGKIPPPPGWTPVPEANPDAAGATGIGQQPAEEPRQEPQGFRGSLAKWFRKLF